MSEELPMRGSRPAAAEPACVVLVKGTDELVVFAGELPDCQAWLALNGDKPADSDGHFELREGADRALPPSV